MAYEHAIQRYRQWYANLLRLHSKSHRDRYAEGMEQTFGDVLRERANEGGGLFAFVAWMFVETFVAIIKENSTVRFMNSKDIIGVALATLGILMIPFVAMRFTEEVNWTGSDFVFAGVLLFVTGLAFMGVWRKADRMASRAAFMMMISTTFLLIWINAAVGIIGDGPINALYLAIPVIAIIGALIARLHPLGMSRTLFTMATVQLAIPVIALIVGTSSFSPGVTQVFLLNSFFAATYAGSGLLFRQASSAKAPVL